MRVGGVNKSSSVADGMAKADRAGAACEGRGAGPLGVAGGVGGGGVAKPPRDRSSAPAQTWTSPVTKGEKQAAGQAPPRSRSPAPRWGMNRTSQ